MAIDFSKVTKIIGPGGKEVKKIVRTSDGVVLWQGTIKRVEFTNPDITCSSLNLGAEYTAYIGSSFYSKSNEGTLSRKLYDTFKSAGDEEYKYFRFYYKNSHEMFLETKENSQYSYKATAYLPKIRLYNSGGTALSTLAGYSSIYHEWDSGQIYGILIYGNSSSGINLQHWTAPAETKTAWADFSTSKLTETGGVLDLLGRLNNSATETSWSGTTVSTDIASTMTTKVYNNYFKDVNNDFVLEFSKTGTEE